MAKQCDFCGKYINSMNEFNRIFNQGNARASLCENCANMLTGLIITNDTQRTNSAVEWANNLINKNCISPDIRTDLISQIYFAKYGNYPKVEQKTNTSEIGTIPKPVSYTKREVKDSTAWTETLKIISIITVIVSIIVGAFIGFAVAEGGGIVIGILGGLVISIISASIIMVIANIAEDIKATREYNLQTRNLLAKILENLEKSEK